MNTPMIKIVLFAAIATLLQLSLAYILYEAEYANILSVRKYQRSDDIQHNLTKNDVQRCMAQAVINEADNEDSVCINGYGLPKGCGLPQDDLNRLAYELSKDEDACKARYPFAVPTVKGASMNSEGNILVK